MPLEVDWTDEPVLTREEALAQIRYPRWLYHLGRDLFSETDMPDMAFLRLPYLAEHEVRREIFKRINNMPKNHEYRAIRNLFPKVWDAHILLEKTLANSQQPAVMSSFGKDSMAVLHMVLQHKPDIQVLWNNTLVEFPSTIKLARKVTRDWNLNLVVARPETTFWEVVRLYGWPIKGRQNGAKGDLASTKCCKLLKKDPTKKMIKKYGWDTTITGITRYESDVRQLNANKYGIYYYSPSWKGYRCHPITDWDEETVFYYNRYYQLPINDLYRPIPPWLSEEEMREYLGHRDWLKFGNEFDFEDQYYVLKHTPGYKVRTGCWPCQIGKGKRRFMRIFYPEMFNVLIHKKGLGDILIRQKTQIELKPKQQMQFWFEPPTPEEALYYKPCYFD